MAVFKRGTYKLALKDHSIPIVENDDSLGKHYHIEPEYSPLSGQTSTGCNWISKLPQLAQERNIDTKLLREQTSDCRREMGTEAPSGSLKPILAHQPQVHEPTNLDMATKAIELLIQLNPADRHNLDLMVQNVDTLSCHVEDPDLKIWLATTLALLKLAAEVTTGDVMEIRAMRVVSLVLMDIAPEGKSEFGNLVNVFGRQVQQYVAGQLERFGMRVITPQIGSEYNPHHHLCEGFVPVDKPAMNGKIAAIKHFGLLLGNKADPPAIVLLGKLSDLPRVA